MSEVICVLFFVALSQAGCSKSPPKPAPPHSIPPSPLISTAEPGQFGGRFTFALAAPPRTFNPVVANDGSSDAIIRLLHGSLINLNWSNQEPGPGLAESWTNSADGKTFTFKLRQGLYWSDGAPLTSDDVVFTWNEVMYNTNYNRFTSDLFRIRGEKFKVSRIDNLTVQVVTPDVFAPFVEFFGGVSILPRHALQKSVRDHSFNAAYSVNTPPDKIVGCGPYRIKQLVPGKSILLERNPEYWVVDKQGRRLPYIDEVLFVLAGGSGADVMTFLNGKSDACETVRPELVDTFNMAGTNAHFRVLDLGSGIEREFLWFNQNTGNDILGKPLVNPAKLKWFRNKKFRQAVSCAIDRERIAKEAYLGRAKPIFNFIPAENQKWNNPTVPRFAFDPAKARSLLAEIGIEDRDKDGIAEDSDGNKLEITLYSNTGNPAREKAATLICDDLKKVGVQVDYLPIDFDSLRHRIDETFEYEAAMMGLGGGGIDPASQINVLRSSAELHQWFPMQKTPSTEWEARIDALMDAQMRTLDFGKRKHAFDEVQAILADEMPMIYTISPECYAAIRENVGNVRPSVLTAYRVTWNMEELFFR